LFFRHDKKADIEIPVMLRGAPLSMWPVRMCHEKVVPPRRRYAAAYSDATLGYIKAKRAKLDKVSRAATISSSVMFIRGYVHPRL
jgi:hypothetical protein